jgi:hypothetical protein
VSGLHWITRLMLMLALLRATATPFSDEEAALAQIIQGEASHEFMRDNGEAAYCVGWVAKNRLESGEYGSSYQEVQEGFNGSIVTDPKWRYLVVARLVIYHRNDPTDGALYALSQQDVDRLGFGGAEACLVLVASAERAVYFFKEWPGDNDHERTK